MFGAGNAAYSAGDRNLAEHTYAALVLQHPDFADAWNNLAQVTWELGHLEDARSAIARAVALGGPRLANYQQLQTQLMRP
jgi:predicted Zn-dependent protease